MGLKCKKCRHYSARMVGAGGMGYNPAPSCWKFEDTGERPNVLSQSCFEQIRKGGTNERIFGNEKKAPGRSR